MRAERDKRQNLQTDNTAKIVVFLSVIIATAFFSFIYSQHKATLSHGIDNQSTFDFVEVPEEQEIVIERTQPAQTVHEQPQQVENKAANQRPKNPVSYYTPPQYETAPQTQKRRIERQGQTISQAWEWEIKGGYSQQIERGIFYYVLLGEDIDTNATCSNYQSGSITFRSCRKAAAEHFKARCRQGYYPACTAQYMRP